jgi:putative flippase GtrA
VLQVKLFAIFVLLSGTGWICDFGTFTLLTVLTEASGFTANVISSYVGVTFVWFASLRVMFKQRGEERRAFLLIYWCFQLVSILAYSRLLYLVAGTMAGSVQFMHIGSNPEMAAKIIITPFNLMTNFSFMKLLMRLMRKEHQAHV